MPTIQHFLCFVPLFPSTSQSLLALTLPLHIYARGLRREARITRLSEFTVNYVYQSYVYSKRITAVYPFRIELFFGIETTETVRDYASLTLYTTILIDDGFSFSEDYNFCFAVHLTLIVQF